MTMTTLSKDGKHWELRPSLVDVLVVPTPLPPEDGPDLPMLHRRNCHTKVDPSWPSLVDSRIPPQIREQTIALLWQVEVEHETDGTPREYLFCNECMVREAQVY